MQIARGQTSAFGHILGSGSGAWAERSKTKPTDFASELDREACGRANHIFRPPPRLARTPDFPVRQTAPSATPDLMIRLSD